VINIQLMQGLQGKTKEMQKLLTQLNDEQLNDFNKIAIEYIKIGVIIN
jgi:hypothetical protein